MAIAAPGAISGSYDPGAILRAKPANATDRTPGWAASQRSHRMCGSPPIQRDDREWVLSRSPFVARSSSGKQGRDVNALARVASVHLLFELAAGTMTFRGRNDLQRTSPLKIPISHGRPRASPDSSQCRILGSVSPDAQTRHNPELFSVAPAPPSIKLGVVCLYALCQVL